MPYSNYIQRNFNLIINKVIIIIIKKFNMIKSKKKKENC